VKIAVILPGSDEDRRDQFILFEDQTKIAVITSGAVEGRRVRVKIGVILLGSGED